MDSPQTAPSLALAAYSEDLIRGRRVVVFGDALLGLAETLIERGARLVHVYDENPTRVAEAAARSTSPNISFAPLSPGGIAARDGAFDVGLVDEVAAFSDPAQLVTRLRRALSARGVGFVCTTNPEVPPLWTGSGTPPSNAKSGGAPLSYYDLYDLVATQFDEVRMVGQTPFAGFALADFSPDSESEFSIDTGFVPGGAEEPERYVAVCSHFPVAIEPFCVVQMEAHALVDRTHSAAKPAPPVKPPIEEGPTRAQLAEVQQDLATEKAAKVKLEQLLRDVNDELKRRDEWVTELESRASAADERADAAEAALEAQTAKQRNRSESLRNASQDAQAEAAKQVSDLTNELRKRERKLEDLASQVADGEARWNGQNQLIASLREQTLALEHALTNARSAQAAAETVAEEARKQLSAAERELSEAQLAQEQIAELQATISDLHGQMNALRSDLHLAGDEISRTEQQLSAQGATVRQLQADLADTERFAALLVAERLVAERLVAERSEAPSSPGLVESTHQTSPLTQNQSEAQGMTTREVASRDSNDSQTSPPSPVGHVVDPELKLPQVTTPPLPQIQAREAELEAALQASRWAVEELEQRLAQKSNEGDLLERLYRAEHQLQRQATLIEQYERSRIGQPPA